MTPIDPDAQTPPPGPAVPDPAHLESGSPTAPATGSAGLDPSHLGGDASASRPPSGWAPIPGPADRVSFLAEQVRRRRQTHWYSLLSALTAAIVGIPSAMAVTPVVYLVVVAGLRTVNHWASLPAGVWTTLERAAQLVPQTLSALGEPGGLTRLPWRALTEAGAIMVLPGMVVMVLVWLALRRLFAHVGVGAALLRLGARDPRPDDLEEHQLANVVQEMAIAAGLPAPRLQLLDVAAPNAAVVGSSVRDGTVLVTRGLLDRLDRAEIQAVVGHLIASLGHGDLHMALSLTTVFQSVELIFTVFEAVFNLSRSAWRELFRLLRWSLSPTARHDPAAAAAVGEQLDRSIGETREDGLIGLQEDAGLEHPETFAGRLLKRLPFLYVLLLPLLLLYIVFMFVRFQVFLVRTMIVGPLLMLAYRSRRYLADAAAVQLTRDPDALVGALERLVVQGAVVPGGQWFAHLFIVGPEAFAARRDPALKDRLRREVGDRLADASLRELLAELQQEDPKSEEAAQDTWAKDLAGVASHPSIPRRLKRLGRMGAHLRAAGKLPRHGVGWRGTLIGGVILLPLVALLFSLLGFVVVMVMGMATLFALIFMGLVMALIHALLL